MHELPRPPMTAWQRAIMRVVAALLGAGLLVLGFVFSLVVLGALLLVGGVFGAWWWWRTRDLRRALREQQRRAAAWSQDARVDSVIIEGEIIEGEIVEDDSKPRLPR